MLSLTSWAMGRSAGVALLLGGWLTGLPNAAALELRGTVSDDGGKPISATMVTVEGLQKGPASVTVFTDAKGEFTTPELGESTGERELTVHALKVGYKRAQEKVRPSQGKPAALKLIMTLTDDVANEVWPSAWLAGAPETSDKARTVLLCAPCHQLPSPKVQALAASQKGESPKAREEFWRAIIENMRQRALQMGPDGSILSNPAAQSEFRKIIQYALFTEEDEGVISRFLSAHMPDNFEHFSASKAQRLEASPAVNGKTVIKEYQLPDTSFVREVMMSPRTPYLWGADLQKNRIMRLDPRDGSLRWIPFPSNKATGPHTMDRDGQGYLWISTIENDMVARFDPATEKFVRAWNLEPGSVVHDFAQNWKYEVGLDKRGLVWTTMAGRNRVASLNSETGEVKAYDLPLLKGENPMHTQVYGAAMSSNGHVWFTQLLGGVGGFDTDKEKIDVYLEFPKGTGPRRPTIDEHDVLYVPLYGSGQILAYDTRGKREIGRYDLPDRNAAPYNLTWDSSRRIVWVGTSSADKLYQFDPSTKQFREFPLPKRGAFLRKMFIDPGTRDLWTSYACIPTGSCPSMALVLHPGDAAKAGL